MTKSGPSATSTYAEKPEEPPNAEFHHGQAPGTATESIKEDVSRRRVAEPSPVRVSKANEQAEGSKKERSKGEKYDEVPLETISSLVGSEEQKPRRGSKPRHGSSLQLFVGDKSGLPRHNDADTRPVKENLGKEKIVEGDSVIPDSEKEQENLESTKFDKPSSSRNNDVLAVHGQSNKQERLGKDQHGVSGIMSIKPEADSHKFDEAPPADETTGSKESGEASSNTNDLKDNKKQLIYLKDALGRKYTFPYHACKTWAGIAYLLKEAFLPIEELGPHVIDGNYDLLGPDGSIIMDEVVTESDDDDEYSNDETLSWFWISQMNVILGYWATPWASQFPPDSPFSFELCRGFIVVMLQALLGFTNAQSLRYVDEYKSSNREWLKSDKSTFPPYARNARNGVVIGGTYEPIDFRVVEPTTNSESQLFQQPLPPIELLHSYEYQVNRNPENDDRTIMDKQLELKSLDSWLSLASRTPDISNGGFHLTRTTPALVTELIRQEGRQFQKLDGTASDGGLQDIQRMTDGLIETYLDEKMSKAELLFLVVAMIRTAKVAVCIVLGSSTARVQEELKSNIPVYLV